MRSERKNLSESEIAEKAGFHSEEGMYQWLEEQKKITKAHENVLAQSGSTLGQNTPLVS